MNSSIIIEKNIPMPERNNLPDLPLDQMDIGDSFMLKMSTDNESREVQTLRQRVSRYQSKVPNARFTVRRDESGKGMRVWRVA